MAESLFSPVYLHGIYIPAGLLVVGTLIIKRDWTPYAALLAVTLGSLKFWNLRKSRPVFASLYLLIPTKYHLLWVWANEM